MILSSLAQWVTEPHEAAKHAAQLAVAATKPSSGGCCTSEHCTSVSFVRAQVLCGTCLRWLVATVMVQRKSAEFCVLHWVVSFPL